MYETHIFDSYFANSNSLAKDSEGRKVAFSNYYTPSQNS